jgi:hypothetical protein
MWTTAITSQSTDGPVVRSSKPPTGVVGGINSDEPLGGREAVLEAIRTVGTLADDLTYKEVLSGETHHAAYFRLQIDDTVVNGMD